MGEHLENRHGTQVRFVSGKLSASKGLLRALPSYHQPPTPNRSSGTCSREERVPVAAHPISESLYTLSLGGGSAASAPQPSALLEEDMESFVARHVAVADTAVALLELVRTLSEFPQAVRLPCSFLGF